MAGTSAVSVLEVDCDTEDEGSGLNTQPLNINGEESDSSKSKTKPKSANIRPRRNVDPVIKCQVDLGSGNTKCCVVNCSSNSLTISNKNKSQVTFVTFPRDPSRFTEWIRAIGRQDLLSLMGKKGATDLLICSKHFPENMWVNQNTRLKRLHKNAVPEINLDDDDEIITIIPHSGKEKSEEKLHNSSKKGGIKVKKVSTLLTESALRDCSSLSSTVDSTVSYLSSAPKSTDKIQGKKWPTILLRKPTVTNTDLEKKLLAENGQLKSELDKNMDYILNQKAHYEGIVAKEKETVQNLTSKIALLQSAQRKLWATFEAKLHAEKSTVTNKDVARKEMTERLKLLQQTNKDLEGKLMNAQVEVNNLKQANDELQLIVTSKEDKREPLPRHQFQGENFKLFLHSYLRKKEKMKRKIQNLTLELESKNESGQKLSILNSAAKHLNHCQLAWLETLLHKNNYEDNKWPEHFKELCIYLYETSDIAYKSFMKAFGLAPVELVEKWLQEPHSDITSMSSTVNALFEDGQPMYDTLQKRTSLKTNILFEENITDLVEINKTKIKIKTKSERERSKSERERSKSEREERSSPKKRKYSEHLESNSQFDDEEYEEGKISDEDEELFFSEDSDKDEEEIEEEEEDDEMEEEDEEMEDVDDVNNEQGIHKQEVYQQKGSVVDIPIAGPSQNQQADFDFMLEENSESAPMPIHLGNSMPMLVPDSPMTPLTSLSHSSDIMKVSNRKRVISSDSSLQTSAGSKVIFRVIES